MVPQAILANKKAHSKMGLNPLFYG